MQRSQEEYYNCYFDINLKETTEYLFRIDNLKLCKNIFKKICKFNHSYILWFYNLNLSNMLSVI